MRYLIKNSEDIQIGGSNYLFIANFLAKIYSKKNKDLFTYIELNLDK